MQTNRRAVVKLTGVALAGLAFRGLALGANTSIAPKPLRILILGGTGFIGPHQVRYALSRGHTITVFNRGRREQDWPGPVEELLGDRDTGYLESLRGRNWDVCIDNPTMLPFWVRDAGLALHDKVKQYLFISTVSAYAENKTVGADETAPLANYTGQDAMAETQETLRAHMAELYGPLKAVSEREAQKYFPGKATIVRPGLIAGPGDESDRFTYWPVRLSRGGEVLAPGDGSDPIQLIDVRDLAEWTIRLAESRTPGVFNATGPAQPMTMRDMLAMIASSLQVSPTITWASTQFLEAQHIQAWSDMPVWVPAEGDSAGFARRSIERALKAGLTFRPLATTSADTLAWFRQQPDARQAKLRAGLTPDRENAALMAWKSSSHGATG
jgi:2'-hydroxyisoflavone reductase